MARINKSTGTRFRVILFISVIFCVLIVMAPAVRGQTLSLGVYPPLLEVMIQPGKSITQVYKLTNGGETDLAFTSLIVPFESADEFGNIKLLSESGSVNFRSQSVPFRGWFSFQNADLDLGQKFILKTNQEQEIVLKIQIPENALQEDYYATMLFETLPGVFIGGASASQAQAKIGSNILLTVSKEGRPFKKAEIVEFGLLSSIFNLPIIDSFDKPQFVLRIKNTGKAYFKPIGTISVSGWMGQKYLLDLLPENVLVDSVRALKCANPDFSKSGSLEEFGPCRLESKFLLGRYQAGVEFGLDKTNVEYSADTTFFAFPFKLILGVTIAIILTRLIKSKLKIDT